MRTSRGPWLPRAGLGHMAWYLPGFHLPRFPVTSGSLLRCIQLLCRVVQGRGTEGTRSVHSRPEMTGAAMGHTGTRNHERKARVWPGRREAWRPDLACDPPLGGYSRACSFKVHKELQESQFQPVWEAEAGRWLEHTSSRPTSVTVRVCLKKQNKKKKPYSVPSERQAECDAIVGTDVRRGLCLGSAPPSGPALTK